MKTLSTVLVVLFCVSFVDANTLLQSPVTGQPFTSGKINAMKLVSNNTDVVLVAANNTTKKIYAIDIADNARADSATNRITQISSFKTKVASAIGQSANNLTISNIEVNPISKSLYVLVYDNNNKSYVCVVKNGGSSVTVLDLSSVPYSAITYNSSNSFSVQDLAWGNNTFYISSGGNFSLDGELAWITAPFTNSTSTTNRATTMFKSNWGGQYYTQAPLEKFAYCQVKGEHRLAGVTLCAPGFSVTTSSLTGNGTLQVTEDFNVNGGPPSKVVSISRNGKSYLFDLHLDNGGGQLIRIGEKYLDGSQVAANHYNDSATMLRDNSGNPPAGLTDEDVKIYTDRFQMIAAYSNDELMVLDVNNNVRPYSITGTSGVTDKDAPRTLKIAVFPNPVTHEVMIDVKGYNGNSLVAILYSIDGKEISRYSLHGSTTQIDLSKLSKAQYIMSVADGEKVMYSEKIIKQ